MARWVLLAPWVRCLLSLLGLCHPLARLALWLRWDLLARCPRLRLARLVLCLQLAPWVLCPLWVLCPRWVLSRPWLLWLR